MSPRSRREATGTIDVARGCAALRLSRRRLRLYLPRLSRAAALDPLGRDADRLVEASEDEVEATARLVKDIMEGAGAPRCELSVPLVVETGSGTSWDQAH